MIDHTSSRIEQGEAAVRRRNLRRYAFQRLLDATDRALWRLEEMNRDGVRDVPKGVRAQLQAVAGEMPDHVGEPLRNSGHVHGQVQDMLDRVFEVQERLFRWRFPDWHDWEPEEQEIAAS